MRDFFHTLRGHEVLIRFEGSEEPVWWIVDDGWEDVQLTDEEDAAIWAIVWGIIFAPCDDDVI